MFYLPKMEKKCSKCGHPFGCKNDVGGCWCEDLQLTGETLLLLKDSYSNCLCPDCLKEFESAPPSEGVKDPRKRTAE